MNRQDLRYVLYHSFLLGKFNSLVELGETLEFLLDDYPYSIGFGEGIYPIVGALAVECAAVSNLSSTVDAMRLWQFCRFLEGYVPEKEQQDFLLYLRRIPIQELIEGESP